MQCIELSNDAAYIFRHYRSDIILWYAPETCDLLTNLTTNVIRNDHCANRLGGIPDYLFVIVFSRQGQKVPDSVKDSTVESNQPAVTRSLVKLQDLQLMCME